MNEKPWSVPYCSPGTRVHTEQGLMPIEKIRVGTRVLSQPEQGGERAYRPVVNTVAHLDQQVYAVQVEVEGADGLTTLIATPNHPFWVEDVVVEGDHWLATECLQPGHTLQLADGRKARVHAAGLIRRTQHAHIGFAADDRAGLGIVLDLSEKQIKLAGDELVQGLGTLQAGEPYLTPVYNFEVEEFHTYYVGETGVWVHNSGCGEAEAISAIAKKTDLQSVCFASDTYVLAPNGGFDKIENLEVGCLVMSRCERTGQMAPKRILKIYERSAPQWGVSYYLGPQLAKRKGFSTSVIFATEEHPFWVEGKGWTPVRELQPGDAFLTHNGDPATLECLLTPESMAKHAHSYVCPFPVYNLEVEDFNTYFVDIAGIWVHNCDHTKPEIEIRGSGAVADPKPEWSSFHKSTAENNRGQTTISGPIP